MTPPDPDPSDALRELASIDADRPSPRAPTGGPSRKPPAAKASGRATPRPAAADRSPASGKPKPKKKPAVPFALAAAGVVFLLPAIWGVLFLAGATEMFGERSNADNVALASVLVGFTFGGVMFAAAAFFYWAAPQKKTRRR